MQQKKKFSYHKVQNSNLKRVVPYQFFLSLQKSIIIFLMSLSYEEDYSKLFHTQPVI